MSAPSPPLFRHALGAAFDSLPPTLKAVHGATTAVRFLGWRFGPLPMPRALAPTIRARAFDLDGQYRFSVAVAHPWLGLIFAYAGRLG